MEERKMETKRGRRKLWPWVLTVCLALCCLAGLGLAALNAGLGEKEGVEGLVSVQAEGRNIVNTAVGTGSLDYGERLDVELPEGVDVEELLVEQGDRVSQGQALLRVSPTSVLGREAELLDQLSQLDGQIEASKPDEEATLAVKAGVSGRVMRIYAREGNDARAAMQEHGGLLLLSVDGKLAVDIPAGDLRLNDGLTLENEDGENIEGSVEALQDGLATVCFADDEAELGEELQVYSRQGERLGQGQAYVHQPMNVLGPGGYVRELRVELGDKVSAGTTLLVLEDLGEDASYQALLDQRAELEETLALLRALAQDPTLYAPAAGLVESLSVEEATTSYAPGSVQEGAPLRVPALTIATEETMRLVIQADELDILALGIGQEAQVEFDAISGRSFSGAISKVANTAQTASGTAKYEVEIELPLDEDMRAGMSATATVTVGQLENALAIPVAAVQESGMQAYVYTALDESTGEPAGETPITTGLSDGEYVQVVEGLEEGDTVYYIDKTSLLDFAFPMQSMMAEGRDEEGE